MLVKNLSCNVEVTFWNVIILLLSGLNWLKHRHIQAARFVLQLLAWAFVGFLIGLVAGYITGL